MRNALCGYLIVAGWWSGSVLAQAPSDVKITLEANPRELTVAESIRVQVTVMTPRLPEAEILKTARTRKYLVTLPGKGLKLPVALSIRAVEASEEERDGSVWDHRTYVIDPQLPGEVEFPALDVVLQPVAGEPVTLRTDPVKLAIKPILPDASTAQLRPAAPMLAESSGNSGWWVGLLLLAAAGAGYWLYRHRTRAPAVPIEPVQAPERDAAMKELAQAKTPMDAARVLHTYVRERFGIRGDVLTAEEIRGLAGLSQESREELAGLGRALDSALYGRGSMALSPELKLRVEDFIRAS